MLAGEGGGRGPHHGSEGRLRVQWIAETILPDQRYCALNEALEDLALDIDTLDPATGLARVEEGAVDQGRDRVVDVGVGAHVTRVLAAQLQPRADEALRGGGLHLVPGLDRAGEGDEVHPGIADHAKRVLMAEMEVLEHALGQAGLDEGLGEALGAERRLGGVLQHHGVAGHDRRNDGVDRRQVGVVPRRHDENQAQGLAAHETGEALLDFGLDVAQCLGRDFDHVAGPLLEAGDLAGRLRDGSAHLPGDLLGDLGLLGDEGIDGAAAQLLPAGQRDLSPGGGRLTPTRQRRVDLARAGQRALHVDAAVDRRDALQGISHQPAPR